MSVTKIPSGSLSLALLIGFAPAALLGIPGLIGLAGAVIVGLGCVALLKLKRAAGSSNAVDIDPTAHRGLLLFGRAGDLELRMRRSAVWRIAHRPHCPSSRASIRKLRTIWDWRDCAGSSRYGRNSRFPRVCRSVVLGCSFLIHWDWPRASTRMAITWTPWARWASVTSSLGTVTPRPQPGNPKPRMFRVAHSCALINRMGFNNKGVDHLIARLARSRYRGIRGISIGKNFDTPLENAQDDYLACLRKVYSSADYVAVNVSSPNTARLRELQAGDGLQRILGSLLEERRALQARFAKKRAAAGQGGAGLG